MATTDLAALGVVEAREALSAGRCTSADLVSACLERIAQHDPTVRAFVDLDVGRALDEARERDREPARGPLHGVPVGVKELYDVEGLLCTWGTPIHAERRARGDATVVRKLRAAGAVIVGTTVSTEYAIATAGPTTNPHDPQRTPGGSSSGSAAAVAAGMVPLAVASQAVGSIVRPSVYCGVYGLKPTKGAISATGGMPLSQHLDHLGPIVRHPEDLVPACRALFGQDPDDRYSVEIAPPGDEPVPHGLRALLVEGPLRHRIESPSRTALDRAAGALQAAGIAVEPHTLPERFDAATDVLQTILEYECACNHGDDRDRDGDRMSEVMRGLIDAGRRISDEQYRDALEQAGEYREHLATVVEPDTLVLAPATDGVPPLRREPGTGANHLQGLWTLAWLPVLAIPCGRVDGLPVGVQIVAGPRRESLLIATAEELAARMRR